MSSPNPKAFLPFLLLEDIIGLSSSIFIIICLSLADCKSKRILTFHRILLALSASNTCYILIMSISFFFKFLWPQLNKITYVFYTISYLNMYSITSNCWLTCTLCIFYFLKIAPSQPGILTKLKNMTNTITWWLLLVAEVVSLGGSFLTILTLNRYSTQMNSTESQGDPRTKKVTFNEIVMVLNGLPILTAIVTMVISASLLKYYNDQTKKNISNTNANVKDYRTAVQTMSGFLLLYIFSFLTQTIFTVKILNSTTWVYWMCLMLLFIYPTVQSALLINGNQKLKEALRKILTLITLT